MKPHQVRFHHIRDWPWKQTICLKCQRVVPFFHEHFKKDKDSKIAWPKVTPHGLRPMDLAAPEGEGPGGADGVDMRSATE